MGNKPSEQHRSKGCFKVNLRFLMPRCARTKDQRPKTMESVAAT